MESKNPVLQEISQILKEINQSNKDCKILLKKILNSYAIQKYEDKQKTFKEDKELNEEHESHIDELNVFRYYFEQFRLKRYFITIETSYPSSGFKPSCYVLQIFSWSGLAALKKARKKLGRDDKIISIDDYPVPYLFI